MSINSEKIQESTESRCRIILWVLGSLQFITYGISFYKLSLFCALRMGRPEFKVSLAVSLFTFWSLLLTTLVFSTLLLIAILLNQKSLSLASIVYKFILLPILLICFLIQMLGHAKVLNPNKEQPVAQTIYLFFLFLISTISLVFEWQNYGHIKRWQKCNRVQFAHKLVVNI